MQITFAPRLVGGMMALALVLGLVSIQEPAQARGIKFDVSISQFQKDCEDHGGQYDELPGGRHQCSFDGWMIECSTRTNRCRIYCNPDMGCVKSRKLRNVGAAFDRAAASGLAELDPSPGGLPQPSQGSAIGNPDVTLDRG